MTAVNMNVKEMMKTKFGIDKIDIDPQVTINTFPYKRFMFSDI